MSTIFVNPALEDYATAVHNYLNGNTFMNLNELMNYAVPQPVSSQRLRKNKSSDQLLTLDYQKESYLTSKKTEIIQKLIEISTTVCNGKISNFYGKNALSNAFSALNASSNFDAVFMLDSTQNLSIKSKKVAQNSLISSITGFLILEKGECKAHPNVYSVNLICSKNKMGPILMGCALYCIKNTPGSHEKRCILELADGYQNIPGFITYTRMGFRKNLDLFIPRVTSLYSNTCFTDMDNLPMSVELDDSHFVNNEIIQRATNKMVQSDFDDSQIYKVYIHYTVYPDQRNELYMNDLVTCNQLLYKILLGNKQGFTHTIFLTKLETYEKDFLTKYGVTDYTNSREYQNLKDLRHNLLIMATIPYSVSGLKNMYDSYIQQNNQPVQTWGQYACEMINGVRKCTGCGTKKCKKRKPKEKKRKQTK